ncbi:hypothetical protein OUZ56_001974 [Daphnia magna]|uniref:Uncharacterized protein n=1 Tax=Daphnia magna TaxID=35525 RepID=A0ABR0A4A9_9CRUS|nr:hypothetical protein OUZ56_001974 [Daphnia magna]
MKTTEQNQCPADSEMLIPILSMTASIKRLNPKKFPLLVESCLISLLTALLDDDIDISTE